MKTTSSAIKTILALAIFMILLLALSLYILLPKTLDPKDYASFVNKNASALAEIAKASHAEDFSPSDSERRLLSRGKIDYVWPQENRIIFSIDLDYAPMEGYIYLIYQPESEYVFPFNDLEWYPVKTEDSSVLRWEGGYAGGNGYVNVTRLSDCFFLEKAYLPT